MDDRSGRTGPVQPAAGTLEDGLSTRPTIATYGYELGGEGAEALVLTGSTAIRQLKRVPQLVNLASKARQTQAVKTWLLLHRNKYLRRGINLTRWGGEAMVDTSLAALYQDADLGNTMDLLGFGVDNAPLMTQEENNYLENFGNKVLAGLLLPLGLIVLRRWRRLPPAGRWERSVWPRRAGPGRARAV